MKYWFLTLLFPLASWGQEVTGVVLDSESPIPSALVSIEESGVEVLTDQNGKFTIKGIEGKNTLKVQSLGMLTYLNVITLKSNQSKIFSITLKTDFLNLEQVVVTGTRTETKKSDLPVALTVLSRSKFAETGSNNLSEGLCFQPGLRTEVDCQTCNYSQLRMNGLGGAYSQILFDSKPLFSSMAGLYGLEQLPESMIEQVEVVRGAGSVLYGANAIGGTVNIITRKPEEKGANVSWQSSVIGGASYDHRLSGNFSGLNKSGTTTWVGLLNYSKRTPYDANNDGFSELPATESVSAAINGFYVKNNWTVKFQSMGLWEDRRGGDQFNLKPHLAEQSEWRDTKLGVASADIGFYISPRSDIQFYGGTQVIDRKHYTGLEGSPGYGTTNDVTIAAGAQLNQKFFEKYINQSEINIGYDLKFQDLKDKIPGYYYLIDQTTDLHGIFAQWSGNFHKKWYFNLGFRASAHPLVNHVISTPRFSSMYKLTDYQNLKASWGMGFRPPQAFDTDLHIAFSGGGFSRVFIDPQLKEETSQTYQISYEFDKPSENHIWGFTVNTFYTQLKNPFQYEEIPDSTSANRNLQKVNGDFSTVYGVTLEGRFNYREKWQFELGYTLQAAEQNSPSQWSENLEAVSRFTRTPNQYGYYSLSGKLFNSWRISLSGTLTGPMLVPHYAGAPEQVLDELFESPWFFDQNIILSKSFELNKKKSLLAEVGVKNTFNQYQNDFDSGPYRDSNYVYGPARPRTIFTKVSLSF